MIGNTRKVSVLLDEVEYGRFEAYCKRQGFKKSTLAARLIRDHLEREIVAEQPLGSYAVSTLHEPKHRPKSRKLG